MLMQDDQIGQQPITTYCYVLLLDNHYNLLYLWLKQGRTSADVL